MPEDFRCSCCNHLEGTRCSKCGHEMLCGKVSAPCPREGCLERVLNEELMYIDDDLSRQALEEGWDGLILEKPRYA